MGIHNLLPFVKKACRQGDIAEFSNRSVAVDVSCLLHRGLIGCAEKASQGQEIDFCVHYVMKYVKRLISIGCHVILVFDGQQLPAKKAINDSRREMRSMQKQQGNRLLDEGRVNEAYDCFKRCTTLTPTVIQTALDMFRPMKMVDVIVAPYESDAQLAYLMKRHVADVVVTEDSDLIAFGCDIIIFKMDLTGSCLIYEKNKLPMCFGRLLSNDFDFSKFRRICILSGCDYLQAGLPGIGLNKATTFFSKTSSSDLRQILPRIPRYLNMKSLKVSEKFIESFIRAENTFLYQIVFDPIECIQRPLNDYPEYPTSSNGELSQSSQKSSVDFSYAGVIQPSEIAKSFALGNTLASSQDDEYRLPYDIPEWSIWNSNYMNSKLPKEKSIKEEKEKPRRIGAFEIQPKRIVNTLKSENLVRPPARIFTDSAIDSPRNVFDIINEDNLKRQPHSVNLVKASVKTAKYTSKICKVPTIGSGAEGVGALRNWNCDDLLKRYAVNETENSNFCSSFDGPLHKKMRTSSQSSDETNESLTNGKQKEQVDTPKHRFSSYFINKSIKTSELTPRHDNPFKRIPIVVAVKSAEEYMT